MPGRPSPITALVVFIVAAVVCLGVGVLFLRSDGDGWDAGMVFLALGTLSASAVVGAVVSGSGANQPRMHLCLALGGAVAAALMLVAGIRTGDGDLLVGGGGLGVAAVGFGVEILRDPDEE